MNKAEYKAAKDKLLKEYRNTRHGQATEVVAEPKVAEPKREKPKAKAKKGK